MPAHHFPQIWLLFVSLAALGLAVLHGEALLEPVFTLDRSHVTALIAALVLAGSVHAAWHVLRFSRRIEAARSTLDAVIDGGRDAPEGRPVDPFVAAWTRDAVAPPRADDAGLPLASGAARDDLIELYADRLRSPVDLGWFLVDVTVRLGLLGTIIGFILIFGSLSGVSIDGAEGLRELLVAMSGGMGTALFTTLAGLVGATLLSVQYLILGREAEHLLGLLVRYRAEVAQTSRPGHDVVREEARDGESVGDVAARAIAIDRRGPPGASTGEDAGAGDTSLVADDDGGR